MRHTTFQNRIKSDRSRWDKLRVVLLALLFASYPSCSKQNDPVTEFTKASSEGPYLIETEDLFPGVKTDTSAMPISTARLPSRPSYGVPPHGIVLEAKDGIELRMVCKENSCADILTDTKKKHLLIGQEPFQYLVFSEGHWLEQRIKITYVDDQWVSAFVATSSFTGGAHTVNSLTCHTWKRSNGVSVDLKDLVPELSQTQIVEILDPDKNLYPSIDLDDDFWKNPPVLLTDKGPHLCLPCIYAHAGSLWTLQINLSKGPLASKTK